MFRHLRERNVIFRWKTTLSWRTRKSEGITGGGHFAASAGGFDGERCSATAGSGAALGGASGLGCAELTSKLTKERLKLTKEWLKLVCNQLV